MPSFNVVNYSLRPSKSIQRSLVFEGVKLLQEQLNLDELLYVGFGSIWFTDFQMAHKLLGIREMISIEADEIGFKRAKFNQPFKTVRVQKGYAHEVLPTLFSDRKLTRRPWLIWLDYDQAVDETNVSDIRAVIENAPPDTIFLATFNANGRHLGKPEDRPQRLRIILGSVVPDDLARDDCKDEQLCHTLLNLVSNYMVSIAASISRPGGFVPAFRIAYQDTTPMITVGGILPSKGSLPAIRIALSNPDWPARVHDIISAPPLTLREVAVLQAQLPRVRRLTRANIQRLGFDLEEDQARCFEKYYRYYPVFVQVAN